MNTPEPAIARDMFRVSDFDPKSGTVLEQLLFGHRLIILGVCAVITLLLGFSARPSAARPT